MGPHDKHIEMQFLITPKSPVAPLRFLAIRNYDNARRLEMKFTREMDQRKASA